MIFNVGWKANESISLFDQQFEIVVKAKAYFEEDGITPEQENAFAKFNDNKMEHLSSVEKLLTDYSDSNAQARFTPKVLLFERDGSYALLLDDVEDEDDGVVVVLSPTEKVMTQDEYL